MLYDKIGNLNIDKDARGRFTLWKIGADGQYYKVILSDIEARHLGGVLARHYRIVR